MANNEKNMLAVLLTAIFQFMGRILGWGLWAVFRLIEHASGGIAAYLKDLLTDKS